MLVLADRCIDAGVISGHRGRPQSLETYRIAYIRFDFTISSSESGVGSVWVVNPSPKPRQKFSVILVPVSEFILRKISKYESDDICQ